MTEGNKVTPAIVLEAAELLFRLNDIHRYISPNLRK